MANAIVTIRIMPESPEADRKAITHEAIRLIADFIGDDPDQIKVKEEPVAFGLVSIHLSFVMDEAKGLPESLEEQLSSIDQVQSAQVIDFRRAIG
ncbi:MAG: elongation factor 1-beta [Candidatus Woesearchaeota archaeon]